MSWSYSGVATLPFVATVVLIWRVCKATWFSIIDRKSTFCLQSVGKNWTPCSMHTASRRSLLYCVCTFLMACCDDLEDMMSATCPSALKENMGSWHVNLKWVTCMLGLGLNTASKRYRKTCVRITGWSGSSSPLMNSDSYSPIAKWDTSENKTKQFLFSVPEVKLYNGRTG